MPDSTPTLGDRLRALDDHPLLPLGLVLTIVGALPLMATFFWVIPTGDGLLGVVRLAVVVAPALAALVIEANRQDRAHT